MAIFVDKRQVIIFLHLFRASLYGTTGCDNKISTGVLEDGTSIKKNRKNVIIPPSLPPPPPCSYVCSKVLWGVTHLTYGLVLDYQSHLL